MNQYEITQEISAPAENVWEALSDVRRWPEWNPSVQKVVVLTPFFVRPGSRFLVKQGRLAPLVYEVTAFEPNEFFSLEAFYPGFHIAADHWIVPAAVGKVTVNLVLRQSGWLSPLSRLFFSNLIQKYLVLEAEGLQKKSESVLPYPMMLG